MADIPGQHAFMVPWYASVFRGDKLAAALEEIAPIALRYGALGYHLYRSQEDLYQFWHWTMVPDKLAWERYWYGDEFTQWRRDYQSMFQVPVVYTYTELMATGVVEPLEVE
jgi:hypothetical protein